MQAHTMKLGRVEVVLWVQHLDEDGNLVEEEPNQVTVRVYNPEQFAELYEAARKDVERRNAEAVSARDKEAEDGTDT